MLALLLLLLVLACLIGGFSCMGCAWAFREYRRQDCWFPASDPMPFPTPAVSRAPGTPPPTTTTGRGRGGPGEAVEPAAEPGPPRPAGAGEEWAGGATTKAATGHVNWPAGHGRAIQPRGGAVGIGR